MYYLIAYDISSARTRRIAVKCCKQAGLRRMQKSVFAGKGLPEKVQDLNERLLPLLGADDKLCVMPLDERAWKAMRSKGKGASKDALAPQASILLKIAAKPEYVTFYVPKPGGAKRLIEHPVPKLKSLQQALNRYLQAVYYTVKPDCAYGFIIRPTDDFQPRNIYFNALRHHKSEWFWQLDLQDFFHTVTTTHLKNLFRHFFFFPPELSAALTSLCTSKGRLPMGAPTSPALSNMVCLIMDKQLEALAQAHQATYTRYADDLTFSFQHEPPATFFKEVRAVLLRQSFVVNENKVRLSKRVEQPEITGISIATSPKPTLSKPWLKRLKQEIKIYEWLMSEAVRQRGLFHAFVFDNFRRSVLGQVEFVGFVEGKNSAVFRKLAGKVRWG